MSLVEILSVSSAGLGWPRFHGWSLVCDVDFWCASSSVNLDLYLHGPSPQGGLPRMRQKVTAQGRILPN
jgi:hypothetical protein